MPGEPRPWGRERERAAQAVLRERLDWAGHALALTNSAAITSLVEQARTDDLDHLHLLGMGGSVLAPVAIRNLLAAPERAATMTALDTTDPAAIRRVDAALDPARTPVAVATKSGTTTEPLSLLAHWWKRVPDGRHFHVDPGPGARLSPIAAAAGPAGRRHSSSSRAGWPGKVRRHTLQGGGDMSTPRTKTRRNGADGGAPATAPADATRVGVASAVGQPVHARPHAGHPQPQLETVRQPGQRVPGPNCFVIFGASGDLTRRKLLPALFRLYQQRLLPQGFSIIGVARRQISDEDFRAQLREAVASEQKLDVAEWEAFAPSIRYVAFEFHDEEGYQRLAQTLEEEDARRGTGGNRLYYLATPPASFPVIAINLGRAGLSHPADGQWARIVVEKPFGHDLPSARLLNQQLHEFFDEQQILRIDHYLGKETVQNILVFRFGNAIFEPLWNRRYVDHVEITVSESLGMEGRGGYYDSTGALRDMVQNHMLQVLALVTMEPPSTFAANAVRDEKVKVLRAVRPLTSEQVLEDVVRARYVPGMIEGKQVPGYRQEEGVAPDSNTSTYVAMKLMIDNWRWAGVPFYLRHGKRLPKRVTEVAMVYNRPPLRLFRDRSGSTFDGTDPNTIALRIQPDEGISLSFAAKAPGPTMSLGGVDMDFLYSETFGTSPPEAYERLLLDAMLGDHTLFTRSDEVEVAWSLITPVLETWERMGGEGMSIYEAGTWGPRDADELIGREGKRWRLL